MATSPTEPSVLPVDCAALRLIPSRRSAYQLHYDRWLELGVARQGADEIAESNAIEVIMAKAAENSARDASKASRTAAQHPGDRGDGRGRVGGAAPARGSAL